MKLKTKRKKNKKKFLFEVLVFVLIASFLLLQLISKKINPIILNYASIETKRFTTALINSSIDQEIIEKIDDQLFTVTKNKEGEIQLIDFNSQKVNQLLNLISKKIENKMIDLEEGNIKDLNVSKALKGYRFKNLKNGVVCEIPVGVLFGNSLFANLGPVIPVKLSFLGEVMTNLNTKVKSYGVNNAYLELYAHVEVRQRITMPITTKEQNVVLEVPLTMKIIQGKVPNYLMNTFDQNSKLYTWK